jgi:hypothetical protein
MHKHAVINNAIIGMAENMASSSLKENPKPVNEITPTIIPAAAQAAPILMHLFMPWATPSNISLNDIRV